MYQIYKVSIYEISINDIVDKSRLYLDLFGYGYPTIKQRVRRECLQSRRKAYLCEDGQTFDFVHFLAIYPNPEIFFDEKRKTDENYMEHAMVS